MTLPWTLVLLSASLAVFPARSSSTLDGRNYLVVLEAALRGSDYEKAAAQLGKAHAGEVVDWTGAWPELEKLLHERQPAYLALVLAPRTIDANLPRRLLPILTRFDDDPFVDCAFGIITGATGKDAQRFVENIHRASRKDVPARAFSAVSVVVDRCQRIGPHRMKEGVARELEQTDLWVTGKDPGWTEFVERERRSAAGSGLIEWGHCGDSQGIWLFSMYRNGEHEKHWPYDPAKVGSDPGKEMPRLTAPLLVEGVDLFPAVVINGACHAAVTCNTIVGSDIVSTFGDTGGVTRFFAIRPEDSFPLTAIRRGASAYIGSLAANNANRSTIEQWHVRAGGVPLGEVMKRTYDELVLGARGLRLAFGEFADGRPAPREMPMFHDSFHRVLFGDPAFVPWREPAATTHAVTVTPMEGGLRVEVCWSELGADPWVWDPWREDLQAEERGRIYERIALDAFPPGKPEVAVLEAQAIREEGARPLQLTAFAVIERDLDHRPVLHLKAEGLRKDMDARGVRGGPKSLRAVFDVRFRQPETGAR